MASRYQERYTYPSVSEQRKKRKYPSERLPESPQPPLATQGDYNITKSPNRRAPGELAAPQGDPLGRLRGVRYPMQGMLSGPTLGQRIQTVGEKLGPAARSVGRFAKGVWAQNLPRDYTAAGLTEWAGRPARLPEQAYKRLSHEMATRLPPPRQMTREEVIANSLPPGVSAGYRRAIASRGAGEGATRRPMADYGPEGPEGGHALPQFRRQGSAPVAAPQTEPGGTTLQDRINNAVGRTPAKTKGKDFDWRNMPENQRPIEVLRGNTMTFWDPKTRSEFMTAREAVAGKGREVKVTPEGMKIFGAKEAEAERVRAHELTKVGMEQKGLDRRARIMAETPEYKPLPREMITDAEGNLVPAPSQLYDIRKGVPTQPEVPAAADLATLETEAALARTEKEVAAVLEKAQRLSKKERKAVLKIIESR